MEMIKAGPIGDDFSKPKNRQWEEKLGHRKISHIFVSFDGSCITSIQFGYFENGALVMSPKYGSSNTNGHSFRVVKLNHDEYVIGLSAVAQYYETFGRSFSGIHSLTFHTNRETHKPICEDVKAYKNITNCKREIDLAKCDRGEFGGFFGSCDATQLTSIGIYVNPIPSSDSVVKSEKV